MRTMGLLFGIMLTAHRSRDADGELQVMGTRGRKP